MQYVQPPAAKDRLASQVVLIRQATETSVPRFAARGECKNSPSQIFGVPISFTSTLTDVVTGDLRSPGSRARRQDRARLADINDGGARHGRRAVGEGDAVKVHKGDQAAARREVLDDPLGVVLAQLVRLGRERVRDRLAGRRVLERHGARADGAGVGRHHDAIARRDGEAREGVRVVRVPLVPGVEGHAAAAGVEVDTGLEDRCGAGVALC